MAKDSSVAAAAAKVAKAGGPEKWAGAVTKAAQAKTAREQSKK